VVDIDFIHLLYKEFSEARLNKIQDITYKTGGILATLFNYGNVLIQTAGELPNFEFELVPHPDQVVQIIGEIAEKSKNSL
jgi:DNA integrity scanning protein DisA with diadenylate cyclase activity